MIARPAILGFSQALTKTLLVMVLYIITGKLGLLLAVPPGYATVIWPPSGIALGMLLVHGVRLWPGVLLGSFLLNCHIGGAYSWETGIDISKCIVAASIAIGSTLQAVTGRILIARFVGLPLRLNHVREVFRLFLFAAPLSCLVAASVGIATLYEAGLLPDEKIVGNWFAWWVGDMFGILVFLPLVLVAPGSTNRLVWRGATVSTLPTLAMLALMMPLGLSFYAWKITSEASYQQSRTEFSALAVESEKALQHRLDSYETALLGGAGFFRGSTSVSRSEWRRYVDMLQLSKNFPGMNGIGWIEPVALENADAYIQTVRKEGEKDFAIHPPTTSQPLYVINYIEPTEKNAQAVGLNIAFEANRRDAAEKARDTGKAAITKRIILVQDTEKQPGFLLLHPLYIAEQPLGNVGERRAALQGWIYAPFIAQHFLSELTNSQGDKFNLRIYDGTLESPDALIYQSNENTTHTPAFKVQKIISVMQQQWLIIWESTTAYEYGEQSDSPIFVLVGGLLFTGIFGLFLLVTTIRRTETMEWMVGEHKFVIPIVIFVVMSGASLILYDTLQQRERTFIHRQISDDATELEQILTSKMQDKLAALSRMAKRWDIAGGTEVNLWRNDARSYIAQLNGLRTLEWLDAKGDARWVESKKGNEAAIPLHTDDGRDAILERVRQNSAPTLTPPYELMQGYEAFIAYLPLHAKGEFDGYLAAAFELDDFFASVIPKEIQRNYAVSIGYDGKNYYTNTIAAPLEDTSWGEIRNIRLHDQQWQLQLVPTEASVAGQQSMLPAIILGSGLLIALLSALSVRYILISRLKSRYLMKSNALNTAILSSAAYLIVATDDKGRIMTFNRAAEEALGYRADEVVGKETPALWHDAKEVVERAWVLSDELGRRIEPGFDVFVAKALQYGVDSGEWTFIRRDGSRFAGNLTATALKNATGEVTGYLGIIKDITARKKVENALRASEELFRLAMESSPIGQALVSPDGRWLKVNKSLCTLLGYSEEELLANDFQSITYPEDLTRDLELVNDVLDGKIQRYQMEKRCYHKSGRLIWALLNVSLVRLADGSPNYFITQIQDISERREMERLKSEFISTVSHELRTPLTSIRVSLGLILGAMRNDITDRVHELVDMAHINCERLILLINDILDMDKIASGQMRYDIRTESVAEITQQAVQANNAYAENLKVTLLVKPIPSDLRIRVDAARYIQILSNLLSNAAKFSPAGETVEIYAQNRDGKVRICVEDHGPGIAEEFHARIFGKFSQADSSPTRAKGGTGLGLHITKQMVEHMGGTIDFETRLGKGTLFWVEFPQVSDIG